MQTFVVLVPIGRIIFVVGLTLTLSPDFFYQILSRRNSDKVILQMYVFYVFYASQNSQISPMGARLVKRYPPHIISFSTFTAILVCAGMKNYNRVAFPCGNQYNYSTKTQPQPKHKNPHHGELPPPPVARI